MVKINIVDTPGHADFGGEVERVMNMVDGALLLVDAAEGPMAQTRFVLKKALAMGLRVIVVINKMDRKDADPERTLNKIFDLFIDLGATDEQADFPIIYADGIKGKAGYTPELSENLQPLFQTILRKINPPEVEIDQPFQMVVSNIFYDEYRGLGVIGRIHRGKLKAGMNLSRIKPDGTIVPENARYLYTYGLNKVETRKPPQAKLFLSRGLMKFPSGIPYPIRIIGSITCFRGRTDRKMTLVRITSPFSPGERKNSVHLESYGNVFFELRNNVALRVEETDTTDNFVVSGRASFIWQFLSKQPEKDMNFKFPDPK